MAVGRCKYNEKSSARIFRLKISASNSCNVAPSRWCDGQYFRSVFLYQKQHKKAHRVLSQFVRHQALSTCVFGGHHLPVHRWWVSITDNTISRKIFAVACRRANRFAILYINARNIGIQNHLDPNAAINHSRPKLADPCPPSQKNTPTPLKVMNEGVNRCSTKWIAANQQWMDRKGLPQKWVLYIFVNNASNRIIAL